MRKFNYTINENDVFVIPTYSEDNSDEEYFEPEPESNLKTVGDCEEEEEEEWD